MEKQILKRIEKTEQRIVDLYAKLKKIQSGTYSREVLILPVPALNDTVNVSITSLDTIILFEGDLVEDFNLEVTPGPDTVQGDRIYLMVKGQGTISVGSNLNPIQCGDNDTTIGVNNYMVCYEMVFDGNQFTGIDNC